MELESEGIRVAWFDSAGNFGYEEMFERLKDQSFLKKFRDGIREHKKILIVEDRDGRVMGTAGTVYPEKNGRGFFSALAVDPADGEGESAMYCSSACVRRLRTWERSI